MYKHIHAHAHTMHTESWDDNLTDKVDNANEFTINSKKNMTQFYPGEGFQKVTQTIFYFSHLHPVSLESIVRLFICNNMIVIFLITKHDYVLLAYNMCYIS